MFTLDDVEVKDEVQLLLFPREAAENLHRLLRMNSVKHKIYHTTQMRLLLANGSVTDQMQEDACRRYREAGSKYTADYAYQMLACTSYLDPDGLFQKIIKMNDEDPDPEYWEQKKQYDDLVKYRQEHQEELEAERQQYVKEYGETL